MNPTMTEAEIYNIVMSYAGNIASHFELQIAATLAMIVAIYAVGDKLNIVLRALISITFGSFILSMVNIINRVRMRIDEARDSLTIITSDQIEKLPLINSFLDTSVRQDVVAGLPADQLIIILVASCCCILMVWPKLMAFTNK